MTIQPALILGCDLVVAADHGQIYIYSTATQPEAEDGNPYLDALADGTDSDRFVGVVPGMIDLMTPGQWNWQTPMRLEVWSAEPAADTNAWDHEVDVDLDVPDGNLNFEASGGGAEVSAEVPPGYYRVRVSGKGFTELGHEGVEGGDSYRLRLWPASGPAAPLLRKRWPGWDGYR
jgi:hypothetical protein